MHSVHLHGSGHPIVQFDLRIDSQASGTTVGKPMSMLLHAAMLPCLHWIAQEELAFRRFRNHSKHCCA